MHVGASIWPEWSVCVTNDSIEQKVWFCLRHDTNSFNRNWICCYLPTYLPFTLHLFIKAFAMLVFVCMCNACIMPYSDCTAMKRSSFYFYDLFLLIYFTSFQFISSLVSIYVCFWWDKKSYWTRRWNTRKVMKNKIVYKFD